MPPLKPALPSSNSYGSLRHRSQRSTLSRGGRGSSLLSSTIPLSRFRFAFYTRQSTTSTSSSFFSSFSPLRSPKRFSPATTIANTASSTRISNTAAPLRLQIASLSSRLLNPARKAAERYGSWQRKSPYTTQFYTSLVIYALGDIGAQSISINGAGGDEDGGGRVYDPIRTLRALVIGGLAAIPTFKWFVYVATKINHPTSRTLSLLKKVTVSQIVFTPISNSFFFGMQALLSGHSPSQAWQRIRDTVPTSFVNSCKIWPAATAFSFTFVGVQYQSVFLGTVAVGWQCYVSFLNARVEKREREKKREKEVEKARKSKMEIGMV